MVEVYRCERHFTNPMQPIVVYRFTDRRSTQPCHRHEFDELVIVLHGTATHITDDERYPVGVGDVFFLHGMQTHGYCDQRQFAVMNILLRPALLELPWNSLRTLPGYHALFTLEPRYRREHAFQSRLHVNPTELAGILALLTSMETELFHRDVGYEAVTLAQFSQLVVYLARCYARSMTPQSHRILRIADAMSLMERAYAEPLRLDILADMACMSSSTFTRVFKQATGYTPIAYLLRLRIRKAAALLLDASLSVTETAQQVGFVDSNYFTRQFTAIMGISPRKYQQIARMYPCVYDPLPARTPQASDACAPAEMSSLPPPVGC